MKIIKRSEASELYFKRYEVQVKKSENSAWETKHYADFESEAIDMVAWVVKFRIFGTRVIDNDS